MPIAASPCPTLEARLLGLAGSLARVQWPLACLLHVEMIAALWGSQLSSGSGGRPVMFHGLSAGLLHLSCLCSDLGLDLGSEKNSQI